MREEEYRKYVDTLHAPKSLKEETIRLMKESLEKSSTEEAIQAEMKQENTGRKSGGIIKLRWGRYVAAAAAAVILVSAGGYISTMNGYRSSVYSTLAENDTSDIFMQYMAPLDVKKGRPSLESYSEYIDCNLYELIKGYELTDNNITVTNEQDGSWSDDYGKFTYTNGEKIVTLETSKSRSTASEQLLATKTTAINKIEVHFAEDSQTLYAAWEKSGVYYTLNTENADKKEFYKMVEDIIKGKN